MSCYKMSSNKLNSHSYQSLERQGHCEPQPRMIMKVRRPRLGSACYSIVLPVWASDAAAQHFN